MSPTPGAYPGQVKVSLTCATPGATIYYTTNGATPSQSSLVYTNPLMITDRDTEIAAIASAPGMEDSEPATGTYRMSWAVFPNNGNPNPFYQPAGISERDGTLFVTDVGYDLMVEIDDIGGSTWTEYSGAVRPNIPVGIDAADDGYFYVTDASSTPKIVRARAFDGTDAETFGSFGTASGQFTQPCGIAVVNGYAYVADSQNHRIQRIRVFDGASIDVLGVFGGGTGQFNNPCGIAVDPVNGLIYIADTNNSRIVMVNGIPYTDWKEIGTLGTGQNQFCGPWGIALDSSRRIYVADTVNSRIVRMDQMDGTGWTTFGQSGGGIGEFNGPRGVAVDDQGRVYVADTGNQRIVRFDW